MNTAGSRAVGLTLPGLDPEDTQRTTRTLDDQADAISAILDEMGGDAEWVRYLQRPEVLPTWHLAPAEQAVGLMAVA